MLIFMFSLSWAMEKYRFVVAALGNIFPFAFSLSFGFFSYFIVLCILGPPLWSSGQSFWLQIQRSRVRFPALPDFLSGSGSGTGYTQPREVN